MNPNFAVWSSESRWHYALMLCQVWLFCSPWLIKPKKLLQYKISRTLVLFLPGSEFLPNKKCNKERTGQVFSLMGKDNIIYSGVLTNKLMWKGSHILGLTVLLVNTELWQGIKCPPMFRKFGCVAVCIQILKKSQEHAHSQVSVAINQLRALTFETSSDSENWPLVGSPYM